MTAVTYLATVDLLRGIDITVLQEGADSAQEITERYDALITNFCICVG